MWVVEAVEFIVIGWIFVAMVMRALVRVPFGLVLLMIAAAIAWNSGGNWFLLFIAGWFAYHGGQHFFGSLAGFIGQPRHREPSVREALRRAGMLERRR